VRRFIVVTAAIVCTLLPVAAQVYSDRVNGTLMVGFRAAYCGALTMRRNANPYRSHLVQDCERSSPPRYYRMPAKITPPAPYPPYVLALMAPLTRLDFARAALVWWTLLAICCVAAAALLARVVQLPFLVAWAALALSLGLSSFPNGSAAPVCVAALIAAAYFAQRGHWGLCALAVAVAMAEPAVALPAAIAFFVRYPPIRGVLLLAVAMLCAISLDVGRAPLNLEYFTRILPEQALSGLLQDGQQQLTALLSGFGISGIRAVAAGVVVYAVMTSLGVFLGIRLARRYFEPAFVALIPPALMLVGQSFLHTVEIAVAIPVCLLLYSRTSSYRRAVIVSLILLAVPWMGASSAALLLAPIFPIAYLAYVLGGRQRIVALSSAFASLSVVVLILVLAPQAHLHTTTLTALNWQALALTAPTQTSMGWWLRWPAWIGLLLLLAILSREGEVLQPQKAQS
jgi:hypothetical protein